MCLCLSRRHAPTARRPIADSRRSLHDSTVLVVCCWHMQLTSNRWRWELRPPTTDMFLDLGCEHCHHSKERPMAVSELKSIIVFSHLRWNFVFQRPQHLLTRLARRYRIYFFEEPVPGAIEDRLEISEPAPNVRVCRPCSTLNNPGFHDAQIQLGR